MRSGYRRLWPVFLAGVLLSGTAPEHKWSVREAAPAKVALLSGDAAPQGSITESELIAISQGTLPAGSPHAMVRPIQPGLLSEAVLERQAQQQAQQMRQELLGRPDSETLEQQARRDRADLYHHMRSYPGKSIPAGARQNAYDQIQNQMQMLPQQPNSAWRSAGPAPIANAYLGGLRGDASGRTPAIAIHPSDPNTVYIGGAQGGVWKTTNGGASWKALTDNQASLAIGAITLDPSNPNTIYAGTGEPNGSGDSYYGAGILKSVDGGNTWTQVGANIFTGMGISAIVVHPTNPNLIYAASSPGVIGNLPINEDAGIYRSLDGGSTWQGVFRCGATDICTGVSSLVMDPTNANILYAGADVDGLYKTVDGGVNWTRKTAGWLDGTPYRIEVAISQSSPNTLYVGAAKGGGTIEGGVVYKSTNGAESWTHLNTLRDSYGSYCGEQCGYNNVIAVHPSDPNTVLVGGQAIYTEPSMGFNGVIFTTRDGGVNWSKNEGQDIPTTLHADLQAIAFTPSSPNLVWVGTDGGVYRSSDTAATWENKNSNLGTLQFQSIALHPTNPGIMFGGLQDNAKAMSTDGGQSWQGTDGGDGGFAAIDPFAPNYWYGTRYSMQGNTMDFQRDDNGGAGDWPTLDSGINISDRVLFYAPLATDPNVAGQVYWGTHRLYRSSNRGDSWTPISGDMTKGGSGSFRAISSIAIAPGNSNVVFVGTSDGNVQITTNAGASWQNVTKAPLPNRYVSDVAIVQGTVQTLYVTFSGFEINTPGMPGHVFKSTDGGASWTNISSELPDLPVHTIVLDRDAPGTIYIGTDLGVYKSSNDGASWVPFNAGLPMVAVFELALNPNTEVLAAATHGRSIWMMSLSQPTNFVYVPLVKQGQ